MKEAFKGEYLAPVVEVERVTFDRMILNVSGGFSISDDQVISGDGDDVWEN